MASRMYLFRLQILVIDGGLLVLRNVLDQKLNVQGVTLGVCLNNERPAITQLRSKRIITQVQYDTLFPPGGRIPTSSDLDITLIICLLRGLRCFGLNRTFDWNRTPQSTDVSLEADIWRLKYCRNEVSHILSTKEIDQTKFQNYWNDIEQVLIRLNPTSAVNIRQTISDFVSCPLDEEEEERIKKEIEKWEQCENKVDRLQEDMFGVKKDLRGVQQGLDDMKRRQDDADKMKENTSNLSTDEEIYQKRKKDLKDDLIDFYRLKFSRVQLSPLFDERDTPLASFYIRPELKEKVPGGSENEFLPKTLSDIFLNRSDKDREIYLSADAGIGTTTFSKYLLMSWCQAHVPEELYVNNVELLLSRTTKKLGKLQLSRNLVDRSVSKSKRN